MDPATIVDGVRHLMVDRYTNTAGATVWLYDYLMTFSAEHKYIWKRNWSLVKILYLLARLLSLSVARDGFDIFPLDYPSMVLILGPQNRYATAAFLLLVLYHLNGEQRGPLSLQFCAFYDITVTVLRAIQLLASTWLILIVMQSLSLDNRGFKIFIYLVFFATNIVAAVFAIITLEDIYPTIEFASLNVCVSKSSDFTRGLYLSQVPFDVLLLTIELYYYWRFHRFIAPARPTKLIAAMYLDGVWYFVATIIVKLSAGVVIIFGNSEYWYIASSEDQAFTSIFIARLVLHLRSVASRSSAATYTDTSNVHIFDGISIGPKITVTVAGGDQGHDLPEEYLGVQRLERQDSHDDESGLGDHSSGDDQWIYREDDALEMDMHVKKKSLSASMCFQALIV